MKVTYLEKGREHDFKRYGDTVRVFHADSYFKPEGTSLLYFRIDRFNLRVIGEEDIIKIEEE